MRAELVEVADAERAPAMKAYQRDQFPFLGVASKERRAAQKATLGLLGQQEKETGAVEVAADELVAFAEECWRQDEREFQYVGADALRKHQKLLQAHHLPALRGLITTKSWWDTVDSLAVHTVGPVVARHPELSDEMDEWIDDDDIWVARTAILHQLSYKEQTDPDRLFAYADKRATDTEFFIRKALGWALRQYARTDPDAVRSFVASREEQLSGLTKREALKHLS